MASLALCPAILQEEGASYGVTLPLFKFASAPTAKAACNSGGVAVALVALAGCPGVVGATNNCGLILVGRALLKLAAGPSDAWVDACIAAGVPAALVTLAGHPYMGDWLDEESRKVRQEAARVFREMASSSDAGLAACLAAGAPAALVDLAGCPNIFTAGAAARALTALAASDEGAAACVAAGAPAALVALAGHPQAAQGFIRDETTPHIARAIRVVSSCEAGAAACLAAGSVAALTRLLPAAAEEVANAIGHAATLPGGLSACIEAGAPAALLASVDPPGWRAPLAALLSIARALKSIAAAVDEPGGDACVAACAHAALGRLFGDPPILDEAREAAGREAESEATWLLERAEGPQGPLRERVAADLREELARIQRAREEVEGILRTLVLASPQLLEPS
jgi:hypothetical protein